VFASSIFKEDNFTGATNNRPKEIDSDFFCMRNEKNLEDQLLLQIIREVRGFVRNTKGVNSVTFDHT